MCSEGHKFLIHKSPLVLSSILWMFRGIESKLHLLWSLGPRSTTHVANHFGSPVSGTKKPQISQAFASHDIRKCLQVLLCTSFSVSEVTFCLYIHLSIYIYMYKHVQAATPRHLKSVYRNCPRTLAGVLRSQLKLSNSTFCTGHEPWNGWNSRKSRGPSAVLQTSWVSSVPACPCSRWQVEYIRLTAQLHALVLQAGLLYKGCLALNLCWSPPKKFLFYAVLCTKK